MDQIVPQHQGLAVSGARSDNAGLTTRRTPTQYYHRCMRFRASVGLSIAGREIRQAIAPLAILFALTTSLPALDARADGPKVDLALVLAIDCSYSVDSEEYLLQTHGLARAFLRPEVMAAIGDGLHGGIAVTVVQWSSVGNQRIVLPWTVISSAGEAAEFSARVMELPRMVTIGSTSITAAMLFSAGLLRQAPVAADRRVIDITADGRNNSGDDPRHHRDGVGAQGITVNGLAILNEVETLDRYFELYVSAGPGNFVIVANDYAAYGEAMVKKLLREIRGPGIS